MASDKKHTMYELKQPCHSTSDMRNNSKNCDPFAGDRVDIPQEDSDDC